jgi:hypothetical protein
MTVNKDAGTPDRFVPAQKVTANNNVLIGLKVRTNSS